LGLLAQIVGVTGVERRAHVHTSRDNNACIRYLEQGVPCAYLLRERGVVARWRYDRCVLVDAGTIL